MPNPIKYSIKSEIVPLLILLASLILGVYFYQHFPDRIASHWNFEGAVNGYSGKFFGAIGLPLIFIFMYLMFLGIPYLDPKKDRYADFAPTYLKLRDAIIFCLFLVYLATGFYNLGYNVPIGKVVPFTIGLMMIFLGNLMGKLKNNWFVGIRTPWTLSSENVWNKTHRMGGYMFIIFGLLIMVSPLLPKVLGMAAFILGIILVVFGTMVYSYLVYRREQKLNRESGSKN